MQFLSHETGKKWYFVVAKQFLSSMSAHNRAWGSKCSLLELNKYKKLFIIAKFKDLLLRGSQKISGSSSSSFDELIFKVNKLDAWTGVTTIFLLLAFDTHVIFVSSTNHQFCKLAVFVKTKSLKGEDKILRFKRDPHTNPIYYCFDLDVYEKKVAANGSYELTVTYLCTIPYQKNRDHFSIYANGQLIHNIVAKADSIGKSTSPSSN